MRNVMLALGFDIECPYGDISEREKKQQRRENLETVDRVNSLCNAYDAGRTFFLLGGWLEEAAEDFEQNEGLDFLRNAFRDGDIQQHTHSHLTVREIPTRPDKKWVTPEEFSEDLRKADEIISDIFDLHAIGLRMPLGYSHGLTQSEDFPNATEYLKAVFNNGIRFISSDLRDKNWNIYAPILENGKARQPHSYSEEGYRQILEIPSHGWQDTEFVGSKTKRTIEPAPTHLEGRLCTYLHILNRGIEISEKQWKLCYRRRMYASLGNQGIRPQFGDFERNIALLRT